MPGCSGWPLGEAGCPACSLGAEPAGLSAGAAGPPRPGGAPAWQSESDSESSISCDTCTISCWGLGGGAGWPFSARPGSPSKTTTPAASAT
eukprot:3889991-Pyramimonas_sp.AAC.1